MWTRTNVGGRRDFGGCHLVDTHIVPSLQVSKCNRNRGHYPIFGSVHHRYQLPTSGRALRAWMGLVYFRTGICHWRYSWCRCCNRPVPFQKDVRSLTNPLLDLQLGNFSLLQLLGMDKYLDTFGVHWFVLSAYGRNDGNRRQKRFVK